MTNDPPASPTPTGVLFVSRREFSVFPRRELTGVLARVPVMDGLHRRVIARWRVRVNGDELSGAMTAGGISITFDTTVQGAQMSGTYDAVSAGACTGDTGTFTATR